jgi:hypothetical protein
MDTKKFEEELARQNAELAAAFKSLEQSGRAGISIPEEALRALDAACEVRPVAPRRVTPCNPPGIRG